MSKEWVGPSAYARHRGVNLSSVKDWIKEGKLDGAIKKGSNDRNKIHLILADQLLDGPKQHEDMSNKDVNPSGNQNMSLQKARTAKTALEAKVSQLKYEKLAGNLVNKSEVINAAKEMAQTTKQALMTIPDRLAPVLAAEQDIGEINLILSDAIEEALRNLASENYSFFQEN